MNKTIPGFREDCLTIEGCDDCLRIEGLWNNVPDCGSGAAVPDGMQESYCSDDCSGRCEAVCGDSWDWARCMRKCERKCMDVCLYVPCCTRQTMCDDGWLRVRESCKLSYYGVIETSEWKETPCFCGG
jgi:hypothetical protein